MGDGARMEGYRRPSGRNEQYHVSIWRRMCSPATGTVRWLGSRAWGGRR